MRHSIGTDLRMSGGLNPILGGYLAKYLQLPSAPGKLSDLEERERAFKINSIQQQANFTPYVNDFLRQRNVYAFEPTSDYYKNLEGVQIGTLVTVEGVM